MSNQLVQIAVVLVLYRKTLRESKTWITLATQTHAEGAISSVLLWYNSSEVHDLSLCTSIGTEQIRRVVRPDNPGLAIAYNEAVKLALESNANWVLTLDQDTELPPQYLEVLVSAILNEKDPRVVAFCPRVVENGKNFSPIRSYMGAPWPSATVRQPGTVNKPISAINSGLCIKASFIREIGGYNADFPLDYLDHWLCREIYRNERKICVLPIDIEHQLSLNDFHNAVSIQRYKSILAAQRRFFTSSGSWFSRIMLVAIVLWQALRKTRLNVDSAFVIAAWQEFLRSLRCLVVS